MLINENISVEVLRLSKEISNAIQDNMSLQHMRYSQVNNRPFLEGNIKHNINNRIDGIEELDIDYVIYFVSSNKEYNSIGSNDEESLKLNSYSDYDSRKICIVSGYNNIEGEMIASFFSTIMHEINHLYEYGKGLEKNVSLYEKTIEMINSEDIQLKYVGYTLYYTFRHEQDAFAHQFYGFLIQNKPQENIEYLLNTTVLRYCKEYYNIIIKNFSKDKEFVSKLNKFGFSLEKWKKRVHYGLQRLERKMRNAYKLFVSKVNEQNISRSAMIFENYNRLKQEQYKNMIFCNESFYNFSCEPILKSFVELIDIPEPKVSNLNH